MDVLQQNKLVLMAMVDGKQDANLGKWGKKNARELGKKHQEGAECNEGAVVGMQTT